VPHAVDVAPGHVAHDDHRLRRLLLAAVRALARDGGVRVVADLARAALARHRLSKPQRWVGSKLARLRSDAGDELGDLLDEAGAMVAVEFGPGREGARVGAIDEQLAVEVIDLVLVGPGL